MLGAIPNSAASRDLLYPPIDLSYFDSPIPPGPSEIHFGYASITWGGNDRQAIADVSSLGFLGIQIRSNAVDEFKSPQELADLLAKNKLTFVALSSGGVNIDAPEADQIAKHAAHAKFLKEAGTDKSKILSANIWLTDIGTWGQMNEIWDAWVSPGNTPARATVEAKLANPALKVEIMVQAALS